MTAADRPSVTDNARAEQSEMLVDAAAIPMALLAVGRAETTTEEWPRCKASRDGGCDRCHDEHGRHIPCRAETTTATDEDMFEQAWEVIVRVRDAHPRTVDDAPTEDIVDALIDAGLLATARTRPTREQIDRAVGEVLSIASNHPNPVAVLGRSIAPLRTKITDAVLDLLRDGAR